MPAASPGAHDGAAASPPRRCRSPSCRRLLVLPVRAAATDERPAVIGRRVIGHSVQGRPIVAWHLGEPGKPKVVLISLMHGNEPAPRRILTDLRDGYPVHDVNLWVVPVYNPDGFARRTRKNAHGVDPNRNYPFKWARLTGGYDSGPKPASEPETRAMMRFLSTVKPAYVLSFHQPLHGVDITAAPGVLPPRREGARPADDAPELRQHLPRHHDDVVQPPVPRLRAHRGVRRRPRRPRSSAPPPTRSCTSSAPGAAGSRGSPGLTRVAAWGAVWSHNRRRSALPRHAVGDRTAAQESPEAGGTRPLTGPRRPASPWR